MQAISRESNRLELQRRAHVDLTKRAQGGIFIYLLGWLILSMPSATYAKFPEFFYLNTALLAIIMVVRLAHLVVSRRHAGLSIAVMRNWLVWSTLAGALHWGLMTAWVLTHPVYAELEFTLIASAAVLGIAGTTALSIAREIRFLFPLFILAPIVVALSLRGTADDLMLAAMVVLAVVYVIVTAKTANQDYWQAIGNQMLAEERAREMEKLSVTDQLTQLNNRSYFDRRFVEEWKRGSRLQSPLSILMLDLDHFKKLNDSYGHVFGDQCLQLIAVTLRHEMHRETDVLARYGGEEFVILLVDTDAAGAAKVAERLRAAVAASEIFNAGSRVAMSCSVGGATRVPDHRVEIESLLMEADAALYRAKDAGRNCYRAADPAADVEEAKLPATNPVF